MSGAEGREISMRMPNVTRRDAIAVIAAAPLGLIALVREARRLAAAKRDKRSRGSGKEVVRVAKKHEGAKYKSGGESPRGFDCSGFTWYCYDKATGMDIGRTVEAQWKHGKSVGNGDWKDGDVVFFKNTFEKGLSHNGIYIGRGKFIHAENERTGVVVSSLESGYYDDHYAGARRLV